MFGSVLKSARVKHGLSQQDVADDLGIDRVSLSAWEADRADPVVRRMPAVVRAYQLDAEEQWEMAALLGLDEIVAKRPARAAA